MNLKDQEDLLVKVERAKEQIAKLRKQQADLEREKTELEELKNREEEWYRGKKECAEALQKAIAILESQDADLNRMIVLVRNTRESFSAILDQLHAVKEERWTPGTLREDLSKSLLVIQKARNELSAARGRIPALEGKKARVVGGAEPPVAAAEWGIKDLTAGDLVRIGFWLALPAALMVIVVMIIFSML
jgi:chromosome segregation ATPase